MSEDCHNSVVFKKITKLTNVEEETKAILEKELPGKEMPSYCKSYKEWFKDEFNLNKYFLFKHNSEFYLLEVLSFIEYPDTYYSKTTFLDKTVDISALFYNGGTCMSEIVEDELKENFDKIYETLK